MLFFDDPDKIIKVTVNYRGNKVETKAKKEEDNLYNILANVFKLNISRMFFVEGGKAIQGEDLSKNFQELNKNENEKREMNILAYDNILDNNIKKDKNNDNDNYLTNDKITVNSGTLINTNNSDNSILQNKNEDYNQYHIRRLVYRVISIFSLKHF